MQRLKKKVGCDEGAKGSGRSIDEEKTLWAMEDEEGEVAKPFRRKFKKNGKDAGTSKSPKVIIFVSTIERLLAQVVKKKNEVKEEIHRLEEDTQLLLSANELDRELREEEIE